jgi:hypothetical protein
VVGSVRDVGVGVVAAVVVGEVDEVVVVGAVAVEEAVVGEAIGEESSPETRSVIT